MELHLDPSARKMQNKCCTPAHEGPMSATCPHSPASSGSVCCTSILELPLAPYTLILTLPQCPAVLSYHSWQQSSPPRGAAEHPPHPRDHTAKAGNVFLPQPMGAFPPKDPDLRRAELAPGCHARQLTEAAFLWLPTPLERSRCCPHLPCSL